jgi:hypothetical protein
MTSDNTPNTDNTENASKPERTKVKRNSSVMIGNNLLTKIKNNAKKLNKIKQQAQNFDPAENLFENKLFTITESLKDNIKSVVNEQIKQRNRIKRLIKQLQQYRRVLYGKENEYGLLHKITQIRWTLRLIIGSVILIGIPLLIELVRIFLTILVQ